MKARQLFRYKERQGKLTVEMVIWELPRKTGERSHGLIYRLYCGRGNRCIVRYDNEAAKGDYRHYDDFERNYKNVHTDVAALVELGLLEKDDQGGLTAPFDEIVIHAGIRDAA